MIRSYWKPSLNYFEKHEDEKNNVSFCQGLRRARILNEHVGYKVLIHKGLTKLDTVEILKPMIGFTFGQLSLTKKKVIHQIKKKKKK